MSIHSGTAGGDSDTLATTTAVQDVDDALRQLVVGVPAQHAARDTLSQATAIVPDRRIRGSVPMEGQDGVFSQSWFPVCLAAEVPPGGVRGFDFLDGRVVVWRDATGRTRVTSAFCPHMGASLEAGDIVGGNVRCAFHHWEFNGEGRCVRTAVGDTPPRHAGLFVFPVLERWGIVWAFNGEAPLYDIPDFPFPSKELLFKTLVLPDLMPVDPWMQCANTPDIQHIKTLHRIEFDSDPYDRVAWTPYSMRYEFTGFFDSGTSGTWEVGIYGTSLYYQSAWLNGRWFGFMVPMGLTRPGFTRNYLLVAIQPSGDPEADEAFLNLCMLTELGILGEDIGVFATMRFQPGSLTVSDRVLGRFFDYLRAYPRAHPSRDWLR